MKRWLFAAGGVAAGLALALAIDGGERASVAVAQDAAALAAQAAGPQPAVAAPATANTLALSYAPVVRLVAPAVVNVFTARRVAQRPTMAEYYGMMFGRGGAPRPRVERSLGSGVIVAADGLVITNNHVVAGAEEIVVALPDRREYPARLVFADEKTDLAALRVDTRGAALPVARLGDSDRAAVGDVVLAIGNPFGVGQTVTQGIVSAVARTGLGISDWQFFLQTDAAINPGNSGGALVAASGEVIGINTAIFSRSGGSQGVGFAIPANMVRLFLDAAGSGKLVRAWIGASGEAVTADIAAAAGLDRPTGVILGAITPGSPAERAGLAVGDIVYAIDGKEVADAGALSYRVGTQRVGARATLTVIRDGKARNIAVALAAPPETPAREVTALAAGTLLGGVTVANLSPALAQELGQGLPDRGVVVVGVDPRAPVAGVLNAGDLMEAVGGRPVASVAALRRALAENGPAPLFRFNRGGQRAECGYRPAAGVVCRS